MILMIDSLLNKNAFTQITWKETIGEPDSTHSIDCVWKCSAKCGKPFATLLQQPCVEFQLPPAGDVILLSEYVYSLTTSGNTRIP